MLSSDSPGVTRGVVEDQHSAYGRRLSAPPPVAHRAEAAHRLLLLLDAWGRRCAVGSVLDRIAAPQSL